MNLHNRDEKMIFWGSKGFIIRNDKSRNDCRNKKEVKTQSVYYDPVDKVEDGFRVLIMSYWPRPLTHKQVAAKRRFLDLASSRQLHKDWKNRKENGMTWTDFTRRFLGEFANNPQAQLCIKK